MFSSVTFGGHTFGNRIVAEVPYSESEGAGVSGVSHHLAAGMFAQCSAGLMMLGRVCVSKADLASDKAYGLFNDDQEYALQNLISALKKQSNSKIGLTLTGANDVDVDGQEALVAAFLDSMKRCQRIGVDVVEIDMAGGRTLARYLSPLSHPADFDNRTELPLTIAKKLRNEFKGALSVRLSAKDWGAKGWTIDEAVLFAKSLKIAGVDWISVTSGGVADGEVITKGRLFQAGLADQIRQCAGIAVCAEGGIDSYDDVNSLIAAGRADLVRLNKALMFSPGFIRQAAYKQGVTLPFAESMKELANYTPRDLR